MRIPCSLFLALFLFFYPSYSRGQDYSQEEQVQELLLDVSTKLVSDVSLLKRKVSELEKENKRLSEKLVELEQRLKTLTKQKKNVCTSSQNRLPTAKKGVKIIVATFFYKSNADKFKADFEKKTGLVLTEKKTLCKGNKDCYAMYVVGDYVLYRKLKQLGYKDAFISKSKG